jgi:hypothetical protein
MEKLKPTKNQKIRKSERREGGKGKGLGSHFWSVWRMDEAYLEGSIESGIKSNVKFIRI